MDRQLFLFFLKILPESTIKYDRHVAKEIRFCAREQLFSLSRRLWKDLWRLAFKKKQVRRLLLSFFPSFPPWHLPVTNVIVSSPAKFSFSILKFVNDQEKNKVKRYITRCPSFAFFSFLILPGSQRIWKRDYVLKSWFKINIRWFRIILKILWKNCISFSYQRDISQ